MPSSRQPPAFTPALLRASIYGAGTYYCLPLLHSADSLTQWTGIGLCSLFALGAMRGVYDLTQATKHTARQSDIEISAQYPSKAYGHARLAHHNDGVITSLSTRKGLFLGAYQHSPLFFDPFAKGNGNLLSYAPARSGKSTAHVIPAALHCFSCSMVIPDIKGEITAIAAQTRAKTQRIIIWNAFGVLGIKGKRFNPLDILMKDINGNKGKNLHDLAGLMSLTLIPENPSEKEPFFRNGGRRFLTALILYLAVIEKGKCHLPGLREMVWAGIEKKIQIIEAMKSVSAYGGIIREYGQHLEELLNPAYAKTFGAMRDYAMDATKIFDAHSDFGQSLMGHDFSLGDILNGKTTFFPIIPEEKLDTHGSVLSLIFAMLIEHVARAKAASPLMLMLEEMGNIGAIPNLRKALTLLAFKGIRVWMIAQSRRQLIAIYGEDNTRIFEEQCSVRMQWSMRDKEDWKEWSERIGKHTIKIHNQQFDPKDPHSPWMISVSETAQPVLNEYQIATLSPQQLLIHVSGCPVILARLVPYYRVQPWRKNASVNPYHPEGYPKDEPVLIDLNKR